MKAENNSKINASHVYLFTYQQENDRHKSVFCFYYSLNT